MADVKVGTLYYNVELRGAEQAAQKAREVQNAVGGGSATSGGVAFAAGFGGSAGAKSGGSSGAPMGGGGGGFATPGGGAAGGGAYAGGGGGSPGVSGARNAPLSEGGFGLRVAYNTTLRGVQETYGAWRAGERASLDASLSSTRVGEAKALEGGLQQQFSGRFGSVIGAALDHFTLNGPESVQQTLRTEEARIGSWQAARASRLALDGGRAIRGAGDPSYGLNRFGAAAARIDSEYAQRTDQVRSQIGELTSKLKSKVMVEGGIMDYDGWGRERKAPGHMDFEFTGGVRDKLVNDRNALQDQLKNLSEQSDFDQRNNFNEYNRVRAGNFVNATNQMGENRAALTGSGYQSALASNRSALRSAIAQQGVSLFNPGTIAALDTFNTNNALAGRNEQARVAGIESDISTNTLLGNGRPRSAAFRKIIGGEEAALKTVDNDKDRDLIRRSTDAELRATNREFRNEDSASILSSRNRTSENNLLADFKPISARFAGTGNRFIEQIDAMQKKGFSQDAIDSKRDEGLSALKAQFANVLASITPQQMGINQADTTGGQTGAEQMQELINALNANTAAVETASTRLQ